MTSSNGIPVNLVLKSALAVLSEGTGFTQQVSDIHISDGKIVQIVAAAGKSGPSNGIPNGAGAHDVQIIECDGLIAVPGFIDTHRHFWQSLFKTLPAEMTLFQFLAQLNVAAASFYSPDDAYVAQLCGALEAIESGVTTVMDHYHLANSPEHIQQGFQASQDSLVRTVFAMGTNALAQFPLAEKRQHGQLNVADAAAGGVKELAFADPSWQLEAFRSLAVSTSRALASPSIPTTTLGLALDRWKKMSTEQLLEFADIARSHQAGPLTLHVSNGVLNGKTDLPLLSAPLKDILGPDVLLSHANMLTPEELQVAAERGVKLSATPEVEHHLNMGQSIVEKAERVGCCTALGTDTTAMVEGSPFGYMRASLAELRRSHNAAVAAADKFPRKLQPHAHDALRRATVVGAEALGLSDRVGRLAVGHSADIVLVRGDSFNMLGSLWAGRDAATYVVTQATVADVHSVIVDGRVLKTRGQLAPLTAEVQQRLEGIAKRRSIPFEPSSSGFDLLHRLAADSAKSIFERAKYVDLEAVQRQMGGFLGVNARLE
ncbi:hypothetical protein V8E36_008901 [Tilletia maclaganii]